MQHYLTMIIAFLLQTTQAVAGDSYLIQTALANGSIGAILFVIWFFTFKYALKQNQEQFDRALQQIKEQHTDNLAEQRRINDRLFEVIRRDAEYKEILTGVLTEMKNQIQKVTDRS